MRSDVISWAGDYTGSCLAHPKDESGIAGSEDQPCFLLYMQTARLTKIP